MAATMLARTALSAVLLFAAPASAVDGNVTKALRGAAAVPRNGTRQAATGAAMDQLDMFEDFGEVAAQFDNASAYAAGSDRCDSAAKPEHSLCTGCPPMYKGKLCASTTRYNNRVMGSCGCGGLEHSGASAEELPLSFWSLNSYTAALNAKSLDPASPRNSWCPTNCEQCYELCSTGGTTQGQTSDAGTCKVFKIVDRCGDGYKSYPEWCSNEMSWEECERNPQQCRRKGNTNKFGYSAHFDLQDMHSQILEGLGWDNIEVTFETVSCSRWQGPVTGPQTSTCGMCELFTKQRAQR